MVWKTEGLPSLLGKRCQPKDKGGLGVLDISTHSKCLLMKHLHKLFNHHDVPWVKLIWESYYRDKVIIDAPHGSFWWKSIIKLSPEFKALANLKWAMEIQLCFGKIIGLMAFLKRNF